MASVSIVRPKGSPNNLRHYGSTPIMHAAEAATADVERPRQHLRQTQSLFGTHRLPSLHRGPPPPEPTWAEQKIEARPEQALDHAFEAAVQRGSRTSHTWLTAKTIRARPAAVLALFACTGAAVACATGVADTGKVLRYAVVDCGMRSWTHWLQAHGGAPVAVPAALACNTVALSMTASADALAVICGIIACISTPVAAAPVIWIMPQHMRAALADGLCSYLVLQQRLADVEALLKGKKSTRSVEAEAEHTQALQAACTKLRAQVDSLTHTGPRNSPPEPRQAHFQFVMNLAVAHPNVLARLGMPQPPGPERLNPMPTKPHARFGMGRRQTSTPTLGRAHPAAPEAMS